MTETAAATRPATSKRDAILAAALRLIARTGLHNTPIAAIAREAGVAAGTLYLYFGSKEALINALYLEVEGGRIRAASETGDPDVTPDGWLWHSWSGLARWHLEHPDASNFVQQCEASAILTEETRTNRLQIREAGLARFVAGVRQGVLRDLPVEVFYALFAGPILLLAHMVAKQEIEVTEEILRLTFEGVRRSVAVAPT